MDQSITIKIAGVGYSMIASSPEMEQLLRLAAEDVNAMLEKYDLKFPGKKVEDKLAFVALNETMSKLRFQKNLSLAADEASALKDELGSYLASVEK